MKFYKTTFTIKLLYTVLVDFSCRIYTKNLQQIHNFKHDLNAKSHPWISSMVASCRKWTYIYVILIMQAQELWLTARLLLQWSGLEITFISAIYPLRCFSQESPQYLSDLSEGVPSLCHPLASHECHMPIRHFPKIINVFWQVPCIPKCALRLKCSLLFFLDCAFFITFFKSH